MSSPYDKWRTAPNGLGKGRGHAAWKKLRKLVAPLLLVILASALTAVGGVYLDDSYREFRQATRPIAGGEVRNWSLAQMPQLPNDSDRPTEEPARTASHDPHARDSEKEAELASRLQKVVKLIEKARHRDSDKTNKSAANHALPPPPAPATGVLPPADSLYRYGRYAAAMQLLMDLMEEKQLMIEKKLELLREIELLEILHPEQTLDQFPLSSPLSPEPAPEALPLALASTRETISAGTAADKPMALLQRIEALEILFSEEDPPESGAAIRLADQAQHLDVTEQSPNR